MTLIRAQLEFNDGKSRQIDMDESELEKFSKVLSESKVYWNSSETVGYWTDINKVRDIVFVRQKPEKEVIDVEAKIQSNGARASKTTKGAKRSKKTTNR